MFIFKLFNLNNIVFYFTYAIMFIFLFFMAYKYLYLEQSLFMLSNKLNKLEIEYNNPSVYSPSTVQMNTAEIIMNEIFNECTDSDCCPINKHPYDDEIEKNEENKINKIQDRF